MRAVRHLSTSAWLRRVATSGSLLLAMAAWPWQSLVAGSAVAEDVEWPAQARDLYYGESLYHYYQGQSFDALTRLNVAKLRGGIQGHGGHPLLVEGGLLLAYGMTREAQRHFESVLSEELEARVPLEVRNQSWFYLGKVYYLEQDYPAAVAALEKVDLKQLEEQDIALYHEWFYLRGQLSMQASQEASNSWSEQLPEDSIWRVYLRYNEIMLQAQANADKAVVSNALEELMAKLESLKPEGESEQKEQEALIERMRLTLGQLYLQYEEFEQAESHLRKAALTGPMSDQALFNFAIAATHREQYGLALSALNKLRDRPLFTPWLEQVPYALAYLYEQLGDQELALHAYQAAAERYDQQLGAIAEQRKNLDESVLLAALAIPFDSEAGDDVASTEQQKIAMDLGSDVISNDSYGRLQVLPTDFSYVQLLSDERFQLGLRDLHELYKLKRSLGVWQQRLDSFEVMLETRARQREARLQKVSEQLAAQEANVWQARQNAYSAAVKKASQEEDQRFFMNEDQLEFVELIDSIKANLAQLPDDEDKAEYQQKLARIEAYFDWWIADQYGPNRWAAEKQVKLLERAMDEFKTRHSRLQFELGNADFQQALEDRVRDGKQRLERLASSLERALDAEQGKIVALVDLELEAQLEEIKRYRLASRHAIARLADVLYQKQQGIEERVMEGQGTEESNPPNGNADESGQEVEDSAQPIEETGEQSA